MGLIQLAEFLKAKSEVSWKRKNSVSYQDYNIEILLEFPAC